uniref:Transmembrane protein n=1 Tax=Dechloromonas aromatica (strain RCB) TaxID=159087 RepID=Q47E03_DECAR
MWPSVFKVVGGSLLTFALVWALVLGWWQSNDYEPSKLDLALYLGALPLAFVGGYLLLRSFIEHLKAPPVVDKPAAPALRDDDPLAATSAKTAAVERAFNICLLEGFVTTAVGASTDDVLSAIDGGQRPVPSFRLTDEAGFPVFLAEVKDLDVDGLQEKIAADAAPIREFAGREGVARTLALLDQLLGTVKERLTPLLAQEGEALKLRVIWLIPANWDSSQLAGLRAWLQLNYWPDQARSRLEISLVPVGTEVDAMHQLDEINLRTNRDPSNSEVTLLLGAVSAVDEQTVESWAAGNRLFSADHQDRRIPGEGAVALLLASRATVERLDLPEVVVLSRVSMGARDKPVDSGGRIGGKLIEQLVTGLLDVSVVESTQVKTALLDADHRATRVAEAMEGLGQTFAHLDPIKDCLAVGTVSGDLSPIGSLIALACARTKVQATEAPVLCLSNQHERDRAVLLAMPFTAQPNTESSPT